VAVGRHEVPEGERDESEDALGVRPEQLVVGGVRQARGLGGVRPGVVDRSRERLGPPEDEVSDAEQLRVPFGVGEAE
jgi:hypothetical protein